MDQSKLEEILAKHALYLALEDDGERANLSSADLSYANLSSANLRSANLRSADLSYANLRHANLSYANLRHANLSYADLRHANLRSADLSSANLRHANLRHANLSYANLSSADLRYADLRHADLSSADLRSAVGILLLPVQDMRGYSFTHAINHDDIWKIHAGCRLFNIEEAKTHWGDLYEGEREQGDMYLYAIEWLEKKLSRA